MKQTKRRSNKHSTPREFERSSSAEHFSRMWKQGVLSLGIISITGQPLDAKQIAEGSRALVDSVREICVFDSKEHRASRGPFAVCGGKLVRSSREQLSLYFSFEDSVAVSDFLKQNTQLVRVLFEARPKFDSYFGPETRSSLEVFIDPEDDRANPKLFALILTTLPSSEASTRLQQLDEDWWLDQPYEVRRLMNIDVEYVDASV